MKRLFSLMLAFATTATLLCCAGCAGGGAGSGAGSDSSMTMYGTIDSGVSVHN